MRQVGVTALLLIILALSACTLQLGNTEPELALQDIAAGLGDSRLKQRTPQPRRQAISYEINTRRYKADLYLSRSASRAGIVLVPGVVPAGKDDRRLVALATTLARLHFAVLVPDIEGLRHYQVRSGDVQAVADAFRYLSSRPALLPQGRIGIAGFSYGAGPVLLAALQPDIREQVRFVLTMGGYYDLHKVVTYFTTGHYVDEKTGQWRYRPANPYAAWVFALSNADLLERPSDRAWLREQLINAVDGNDLDGLAPPALATDAQALVALLSNTEPARVPQLIDQLSPRIRAELEAINPAGHDLSALQAQVILVHGRNDTIIPYTESVALARILGPGRVRLFLIDGVAHVDVRLKKEDIPKLLAAMKLLLDQRVPR